MNQEKIGKYIKELRMKQNISQSELGERVHVTRQAVSNWENGKTIPDKDVLLALSDLFHVSVDDILTIGEKETLQDVALELVNQNKKNTIKLKRNLFISIAIIVSLIMIFLGYYFINNYNSIKVFKTTGISKNFRVRDGIIISTSKNTYFKLGNLEVKNPNKEIIINKIKLYIKKDNKEKVIFETDVEDRLFINNTGYNELYKKEFKKNKNNVYLNVTYNSTEKELIKLKLIEEFKNDYIMILEKDNVIKSKQNEEKEKQIQYAFLQEEKDYEENNIVRKNEFNPVVKPLEYKPEPIPVSKTNNTQQEDNEEVNTNPTDNNIQEENNEVEESESVVIDPEISKPSSNPQDGEIIEDGTSKEENQNKEINYEEIKNIIQTYGTYQHNVYQLKYYLEEGLDVCISIVNDEIIIEKNAYDLSEIEEFKLVENNVYYLKMKNYILLESKIILLEDTKNEIINKMNKLLMLIYQEKE